MSRDADMDRRRFLLRAGKAGLGVAAIGALGWWAHDGQGPSANIGQAEGVKLPSFAVKGTEKRLAVIKSSHRVPALRAGLEALGGIGAFVGAGHKVVIKVNAAFATPPALGATSNPELVAELVRLCLKVGARQVVVTDNPINDPASCFELSGIGPAARAAGAEVVLPHPGAFRPYTLPGGRLIKDWPLMYGPLAGADRLIGLAPVKDHHRSQASVTMKNWYGLLGGRRNVFHQDINGIISELGRMVAPSLVIADGVATLAHNGPTGGSLEDLRPTDTLILGTDQVAVDSVAVGLLGLKPAQVAWLGLAAQAGVGTTDYESLNPTKVELG
ncbi:MAG: DUF362 domain-containing protein [Proteobacteria bacterium]|nr:DUF362 domain-containing protein [Pseudomonadota bacterium]MBU4382638.1 DUF362 domain-containing protein [Pseudomonadota bacterium]MBU4606752.1 DUF362 domain-containing protein [Pseudomonadota bacterium]